MNIISITENQVEIIAKSIESATLRRSNYLAAIPPELSKIEDEIQFKLSNENASPRSKIRKIYNLMRELGNVAEPYVACGKGCSSCCKMNVTISQIEANNIAEKLGIKTKQLTISHNHNLNEFIGVPCIFLKEDSCTIYDMRPFVCRKHIWFDKSAYWCDPIRSLDVEMPMIGFSGAEGAFFEITKRNSGGVHADIRDFFT